MKWNVLEYQDNICHFCIMVPDVLRPLNIKPWYQIKHLEVYSPNQLNHWDFSQLAEEEDASSNPRHSPTGDQSFKKIQYSIIYNVYKTISKNNYCFQGNLSDFILNYLSEYSIEYLRKIYILSYVGNHRT